MVRGRPKNDQESTRSRPLARCSVGASLLKRGDGLWETDVYTPQVLRGAVLFENSAPLVYKIPVP